MHINLINDFDLKKIQEKIIFNTTLGNNETFLVFLVSYVLYRSTQAQMLPFIIKQENKRGRG